MLHNIFFKYISASGNILNSNPLNRFSRLSLHPVPLPIVARAGKYVQIHISAYPGYASVVVELPVCPVRIGGIVGKLTYPQRRTFEVGEKVFFITGAV